MRKMLKVIITMIIMVGMLVATGCTQSNIQKGDAECIQILNQLPIYNQEEYKGILIKVFSNKDKIVYGFEFSGSTDYDEYGKDILAAAISTISINTYNSLVTFTSDTVDSKIDPENKYIYFLLPELKDDKGSNEAKVLLKSALLGLYGVEEEYGTEFINIVKVEK